VSAGPRSVVVVGGGSVAWIAALALRRTFRHLPLDVTVLDTGPDATGPRVHWTLPSQRGAHAQLGVGEGEFLRATGATFRLASEHTGWQGGERRYVHAHGEIGTPIDVTPFYKWIVERTLAGKTERAEDWSIAALAARNGRFAQPMGAEKELTASFTYGFHVDERAYATFLRSAADRGGVRRIVGTLADVQRAADGRVETLRLADGGQVSADFFVDASGAGALLMSRVDDTPRLDWRRWFPCDRAIAGLAPGEVDPAAMTRTLAGDNGWSWRVPLMGATAVGGYHASAFGGDDALRAGLERVAPGLRDVAVVPVTAGRRQKFWVNNCVALGAAAVELEPLAGAHLHLAQLGLAAFMELFPLDSHPAAEAAEYDAQMAAYADRLRDFTLAHYRAGPRRPGAFWDAVHAEPLPDSLAAKLDPWRASGRLTIADFETFEETDWAWLLIGAGDRPQALELRVADEVRKLLPVEAESLRQTIARLASSMPRHGDFLRRLHAR